jgi:hypothetical protein
MTPCRWEPNKIFDKKKTAEGELIGTCRGCLGRLAVSRYSRCNELRTACIDSFGFQFRRFLKSPSLETSRLIVSGLREKTPPGRH